MKKAFFMKHFHKSKIMGIKRKDIVVVDIMSPKK
jgi:hypothetical protein